MIQMEIQLVDLTRVHIELPMSSSPRRLHHRIEPKKINEVEQYQGWGYGPE